MLFASSKITSSFPKISSELNLSDWLRKSLQVAAVDESSEINQMNILATMKKTAIFIATQIKKAHYDLAIPTTKRQQDYKFF